MPAPSFVWVDVHVDEEHITLQIVLFYAGLLMVAPSLPCRVASLQWQLKPGKRDFAVSVLLFPVAAT